MKKTILAVSLAAFSQACFAEQVILACKGWAPFYESFSGWPLNARSDDDSQVIELDMRNRVAKYITQLGRVFTSFEEHDGYYSGSSDINKQALGKFVTSVKISVNRITGDTSIVYSFQGEKDGKVSFSGTCKPAKPMF